MRITSDPGMGLLHQLADSGKELPELSASTGLGMRNLMLLIKNLQGAGAPLLSNGRRVALQAGFQPLEPGNLERELTRRDVPLKTMDVRAVTGSTNADAAQLTTIPGLVLAEYQSAGRGRRQRTWLAPFGRSVLLSLAWPLQRSAEPWSVLPLAAGVAVCRALQALGVAEVGLKWPNDICYQGCKLGWVLVEAESAASGFSKIIIGLGINFDTSIDPDFDPQRQWTDLHSLPGGGCIDRMQAVVEIVAQLVDVLESWAAGDSAELLAEWRAADVLLGQEIQVLDRDHLLMLGESHGIDAHGVLQVQTDAGLKPVHFGDVSIRPTP